MLFWLADKALGLAQFRRRVRVLVHMAVFTGSSVPQWFVNVTNLSPTRDVEITNVWVEGSTDFYFINPQRPLPKRLKPDEPRETWVPVSVLADRTDVERRFRVKLSSGKVVKSKPNPHVPAAGPVPDP